MRVQLLAFLSLIFMSMASGGQEDHSLGEATIRKVEMLGPVSGKSLTVEMVDLPVAHLQTSVVFRDGQTRFLGSLGGSEIGEEARTILVFGKVWLVPFTKP